MAMTPYSGDPNVISALGTTPQERGITTEQFKAKFDEGLSAFVTWFNDTHKTEFDLHTAEIVSESTYYSRALTGVNENVKIILSETRIPKKIELKIVEAAYSGKKGWSFGTWTNKVNSQACCFQSVDGLNVASRNDIIGNIIDTWGGKATSVTINNISAGQFYIQITPTNGGSDMSANMQFAVHYHD